MRDFLEGELIGPAWVQTDYEGQTHSWFHFILGLFLSLFSLAMYFNQSFRRFLHLPAPLYLAIALFLLFALPLLASRYRRLPLPLCYCHLFAYLLMYYCAWAFPLKLIFEKVPTDQTDIFLFVGEFGNSVMSWTSNLFNSFGGLTASLMGVVLGAVVMGLALLAAVLLLSYAPLLYFFVWKRVQRLLDYLLLRRFYPERL